MVLAALNVWVLLPDGSLITKMDLKEMGFDDGRVY
jgi:hypothetical protein